MAIITGPTLRRRQLGKALRLLREQAGLRTEDARVSWTAYDPRSVTWKALATPLASLTSTRSGGRASLCCHEG
jgi:hypothetical protein